MRILPTGVPGLDLALAGGIRLLDRPGGAGTTIVFRGPPGAGKTVFGVQLAISIAEALGSDIIYACVEILPDEVMAQIGVDGFRFFGHHVKTLVAPFKDVTSGPAGELRCRADLRAHGGRVFQHASKMPRSTLDARIAELEVTP